MPALALGAGRAAGAHAAGRSPSAAAVAAALGEAEHPGSWPAREGASPGSADAPAAASSSSSPGAAGAAGVSSLTVRGGTDVAFSPPADYFAVALAPLLRRMGVGVAAVPVRRGFFPRGGGTLSIAARRMGAGEKVKPLVLEERGEVASMLVRVVWSGDPGAPGTTAEAAAASLGCPASGLELFRAMVAVGKPVAGGGGKGRGRGRGRGGGGGGRRGGKGRGWREHAGAEGSVAASHPAGGDAVEVVEAVVGDAGGHEVHWRLESVRAQATPCPGFTVLVAARTTTGCVLCRSTQVDNPKQSAAAGSKLAGALRSELRHGGCVDEFALDQLLVWAVLADGTTRVRCGPPSLHATTAAGVAKLFFPRLRVEFVPVPDGPSGAHTLVVDGVGHAPE